MMGKSHIAAGLAAGVSVDAGLLMISRALNASEISEKVRGYMTDGFLKFTPWSYFVTISGVILFLIGTILPDIDNEKSILGRHFHLPFKHRTFTHSLFFILPFVLLGVFFRPFMWLAFGMTTHLFGDSFSRAGICWLWPFSRYAEYDSGATVKKWHILKLYRTGKWTEYFWLSVGILISIFLAITAYSGLFSGLF